MSWNGFYQRLIFATLANSAPRRIDAAVQCGVGYDSSFPYMLDQLVLADCPVGIPGKMEKQIEHLGFHVDDAVGASELATIRIKREIVEFKQHVNSLCVSEANVRQI